MKKLLSILLLVLATLAVPALSHGANYYFSQSSGDDSRSFAQAQNPDTPWKSIQKLNTVFSSLNPGDKILFRRGETYFGTIVMSNSGTVTNPITIGAYGNGDNPVITGLVKLSNWKSIGNGIYEAGHSQLKSKPLTLVSFNDQDKEMGRFPNSDSDNKGYLTYESTAWNSITDKELSSWPNWTGAEVVIRKIYWILDRHKINFSLRQHHQIRFLTVKTTTTKPKAEVRFINPKPCPDTGPIWRMVLDTGSSKLKFFSEAIPHQIMR